MSKQRCTTCGALDFEICYTNPAHTINCGKVVFSKEITNVICCTCGQVQNNPMLSDDELDKIYHAMTRNVVEGVKHDYSSMPIEHAQYEFVLSKTSLPPSSRILDIGCSLGGFLKLFAQTGADVVGCEPSEADGKVAADQGIKIVPKMFSVSDYLPASFDLISLRFVFEHLRNPARMLSELRTLLKPGGVVFIEVPDLAHPFIGLDDFFSFGHTFTFSRETLQQVTELVGYEIIALDECDNRNLPRRTFPSLRLLATPVESRPVIKNHVQRTKQLVSRYKDARRDLISRIEARLEIVRSTKERRLVIYGAGTHSAELIATFPWLLEHCSAFVDGNKDLQGHSYFGRPVLSPKQLPELDPQRIVISSREAEVEILSYLATLGMASLAIPLYSA
jgi:2-polyprenyl-3-methyl-5-hydroxy-6-metoxy-1,4-benzoquinol methylase